MIEINKLENEFFVLKKYNIYEGINFLSGENGKGKSLFLDSLVLEKDNNDIIGLEDLIYLPQNIVYYSRAKIKHYIKFYSYFTKVDEKNIYEVEDEFFQNILQRKNLMMYKLSGGERNYFLLMLTLLSKRKWYILDEPFRGFDQKHIDVMVKKISTMSKEGNNFIITDHQKVNFDYDNIIDFWESEGFKRKNKKTKK